MDSYYVLLCKSSRDREVTADITATVSNGITPELRPSELRMMSSVSWTTKKVQSGATYLGPMQSHRAKMISFSSQST